MFRLSCKLIAVVFCFLFVSPPVHACMGPGMEYTIFFNANARSLLIDDLGQPPSDAEGMAEPLPDADVIAEVFLTDMMNGPMATANIVRVLKTPDTRVRHGKKIAIKFALSSCGPHHRNGNSGTIVAKLGTDIEGRLVLCPYSRRFSDGNIYSPSVSECVPSEVEAAKQVKRAAEKGDAKAQIAVGLMYEEGKNARQDNAEALKWFQRAVESGDAEAQYEFGRKYQRDQNNNEAAKWFKLAAGQGHTEAMYRLGRIYEYGQWGVEQSEAEAEQWYRLAAEKGNDAAKTTLATWEVTKSLTRAANRGDAEAQYALGNKYRPGRKGEEGKEAVTWYKLAAAQSHVGAMNELGMMYEFGLGVTSDYTEAIKWYKLAAAQGDVKAAKRAGEMYIYGANGITQDFDEAAKLFRIGAEKGDAESKLKLESLYERGVKIDNDVKEAK